VIQEIPAPHPGSYLHLPPLGTEKKPKKVRNSIMDEDESFVHKA